MIFFTFVTINQQTADLEKNDCSMEWPAKGACTNHMGGFLDFFDPPLPPLIDKHGHFDDPLPN